MMPKKYANINFTPPHDVRAAARRGLKLHEDGKTGPGLEPITVAWARRIADGEDISPDKARQGNRWWGRNKRFLAFPKDSPAYAAAMLWFGSPGQRWMAKLVNQMETADMKKKSLTQLASQIITLRSKANGQQGGVVSAPTTPFFPDEHLLGEYAEPIRPQPLTYKSGGNTGAMIALFLPTSMGTRFMQSDPGALPLNELHVTVATLGKADDLFPNQIKEAHGLMRLISENHPPLTGHINGCGRFCNDDDDGDPFFIIPDLAALPNLRQIVIDGLRSRDTEAANDHGFVPHITLTYLPHTAPNPFDALEKTPVTFPAISLVLGDERYDYPLTHVGAPLGKAALIEKIGARHTQSEAALIQKMHDLSIGLGAECHPLTRRAGARHSRGDQAMVQRIHDDCAGLGATCKALPERDRLYYSQVMKEGEVSKAQSDAPNYAPASTPQRCANCRFFLGDPGRDWCERFDFTANPDYHCDDWEAQRPDEIPGYVANKGDLAALTEGILTLRGGATSGNWGHAGRPGKRGGSGGGGGFGKIGVKPGASRKAVKQAAKKKGEPQAKPKTTAEKPVSNKLDDIFNKAPKGSEKNFTNHLMDKMLDGDISLKDAQTLTARFKQGDKTTTAPKTGNVKSPKKFTEAELRNGEAKKQWASWTKNLSKQEKDAFKAYSSEPFDELSTDFTQINNHLRGKDKNPSRGTRDAIKRVDSGINKGSVPQDTTVFRGFPSSILGNDPSKLVGKTITDKAYTSSSMSERIANQFSKDLIAEIKIPKGSKGAFMDATLTKSDLQQLGRDPEHELVLPRNSKFRILGTKKVGAKTKVFMELVNG
jgi:2'-5' RNA ligase